MNVVDDLPRPVRVIENTWIGLADGTRLAARLWLPEDAGADPVPAILEYLPYRKRDLTRRRDEPNHRYLAGHGYACVRVDVRGTGDSEGLLDDEYSEAELADALEVLRWIAGQPWCTGAVGMMGISWGGFNALQVAALAPPELAAIITVCASDDRYTDDAHFMGGCVLTENLTWGSVLMQFAALPPDPELTGPGWRARWLARLAHVRPFPADWLRHRTRDAYWRRGSVGDDLARIRCPVYAIGGWADAYSNAVPRLLAGLRAPAKGLIGPWAHAYPHAARPGPAIGFLQEALRWWDRWLKGRANGIDAEPAYRVWMQDYVTPAPSHAERPGRWVAEATWPSPRIAPRRLAINAAGLRDEPTSGPALVFRSLETNGLCAGDWCAFGADGEMPTDQRRDDGTSLTFDSAPLAAPVELLGAPVVEVELAVDRPVAWIVVRLCDVAPDGSSLRVTYGLLDLAQRAGHAARQPVPVGEPMRVRVQLNDVAHAFPAGHVVRLALATTYWPLAWPAPEPVTLAVLPGVGWLELPERPPSALDDALAPFAPPEQAHAASHASLRPGRFQRTFERDLASNETVYTVFSDHAEFPGAALARLDDIDLEVGTSLRRRYRIGERDPLAARAEVEQTTVLRRGDWHVRVDTHSEQTATREGFVVRATLRAAEGETAVFSMIWEEHIER